MGVQKTRSVYVGERGLSVGYRTGCMVNTQSSSFWCHFPVFKRQHSEIYC